jgi:hypothetical protein
MSRTKTTNKSLPGPDKYLAGNETGFSRTDRKPSSRNEAPRWTKKQIAAQKRAAEAARQPTLF